MRGWILLMSVMLVGQSRAEAVNLDQGKALYKAACSNCHAPDKARGLKAPPAFNRAVWQAIKTKAAVQVKSDKRFKTVDDYLLYQIKIGRGLMHHGGLCKETQVGKTKVSCEDTVYLEAIQYMSGIQSK